MVDTALLILGARMLVANQSERVMEKAGRRLAETVLWVMPRKRLIRRTLRLSLIADSRPGEWLCLASHRPERRPSGTAGRVATQLAPCIGRAKTPARPYE